MWLQQQPPRTAEGHCPGQGDSGQWAEWSRQGVCFRGRIRAGGNASGYSLHPFVLEWEGRYVEEWVGWVDRLSSVCLYMWSVSGIKTQLNADLVLCISGTSECIFTVVDLKVSSTCSCGWNIWGTEILLDWLVMFFLCLRFWDQSPVCHQELLMTPKLIQPIESWLSSIR